MMCLFCSGIGFVCRLHRCCDCNRNRFRVQPIWCLDRNCLDNPKCHKQNTLVESATTSELDGISVSSCCYYFTFDLSSLPIEETYFFTICSFNLWCVLGWCGKLHQLQYFSYLLSCLGWIHQEFYLLNGILVVQLLFWYQLFLVFSCNGLELWRLGETSVILFFLSLLFCFGLLYLWFLLITI